MRFASEAWGLVVPVLGAALVVAALAAFFHSGVLGWTAAVIAFCAISILLFFRDPVRVISAGKGVVVAPADGKIIESDSLPDGRKHVAIFLSVFNVHVNRVPISGTVESVIEKPGMYFHAGSEEAKQKNARIDVLARSEYGEVSWRQLSGLIARKISCRLKPGDILSTGQTFGLIYFGSRMDVFLPARACLTAQIGQCTRAGETMIATFSNEDKP
jgi:phosphatidylserine decarboxylase